MAKRILQMLAALVAAILFILAMLYSGVIPGRERLSAVADASLGEQTPIPTPTPEETRRPAAFIPLEDTEDSVMPLVATIPAAPLAAGALPAAAAAPIAPAAAPVAAAPAAAPAPITAQAPIAPVGQGVHVVDNALPIKAVGI
ncbi:MAG TPA: hypothetical protein PLP17_17400, partial [Oligoflexia bacterium]|nr:hypothetical protein [Oligoflexia bacterium]